MTDERFRTEKYVTPDAVFTGTVAPDDDPIDDVPDTAGSPRGMIDLKLIRTAYGWRE